MKKLGWLAAVVALVAFLPARGEALPVLTEANATCADHIIPPSATNDEPFVEACAGGIELDLLLKGEGGGSTGTFASFYDVDFTSNAGTITFTGDPNDPTQIISCPECWLMLKDGSVADPNFLAWDINTWDGLETIVLEDIFTEQGGISHISIWGGGESPQEDEEEQPVPEPASMLLLATGLAAAAYGARGRRKA